MPKTLAEYLNVLQGNPDNREALLESARLRINQQENVEEAAASLERLMAQGGAGSNTRLLLMAAYWLMGDKQKAHAGIEELKARYPKETKFRMAVAQFYFDYGAPRQALAELEEAKDKFENDFPVRKALVEGYLREGQKDEALAEAITVNQSLYFKQIAQSAPALLLVKAYAALGDTAAAVTEAKKARADFPMDCMVRVALVGGYIRNGQIADAVQEAEISSRLFAKDSNARVALCEAYLADGQLSKAFDTIVEAKSAFRSTAITLTHAKAYSINGQRAEAVAELEDSKKRFPETLENRVALVDAYMQNGQNDKAAAEVHEILKVFPKSTYLRPDQKQIMVRAMEQQP